MKPQWYLLRNTRFDLNQVESVDTVITASYDLEEHKQIERYSLEIGLLSGRKLTFRFAGAVKRCKQERDRLDRALNKLGIANDAGTSSGG